MDETNQPEINLSQLVEVVVNAVLRAKQTEVEDALIIRDELRRLPNPLMTEVLNQVMLRLVQLDPVLCRWFIVDVFLRDADPEGRADVAERLNLLMAELRSP
ncbi:hypothetical protein IFO70_22390 [Phormidium tenue FACHB-886]|nr:hypothetical protein [Phormidium tenue FACHB-886]